MNKLAAAIALCALALIVTFGGTQSVSAAPPVGDHYKLYEAQGPDGPAVSLVDQFDKKCVGGANAGAVCTNASECPDGTCSDVPETPDLGLLTLLGNPVKKDCQGCPMGQVNDPDEHLTLYPIPAGQFGPATVMVDNQFGMQTLTVGNPRYLAVPSQKKVDPEPLPPAITFTINHFKCYDASGAAPGINVTLDDQFADENVIVGRPFLFCNPVDKNAEGVADANEHLTCYEIPDVISQLAVHVRNHFCEFSVTTKNPVGLCVPSEKLSVTAPTATPPGPTPTPTATPRSLRHYSCYEAPREAFAEFPASLVDEFGVTTVTVVGRKRICNPANKNDEDPTAPSDPNHLTGYIIKQANPVTPIAGVTVQNQFGTVVVDLKKPEYLLLPAAKSQTAPPGPLPSPAVDHFKCYKAKKAKTRVLGVKITDQFGTLTFDVRKPLRFCVPVDKNGEGVMDPTTGLMCYKGIQKSKPKFRGIDPIYVDDQFGAATTSVDHIRELCVPSVTCAVASVSVEAVTNGAPFDNNPNVGGGKRIFAEQKTAAGALLNQVTVVAKITAATAGKTVHFKAFDVDDPSSDTAPVDPNRALGNDNRGLPQAGTLSATSAFTDATGTATVTFSTTRQPGDNFKVVASCDRAYLNGVDLKPTDGSVIQDSGNNALPTNRAKLTDMLTVWRKAHVEVDSMQASANNFYQGTVTAVTNVFGLGFVSTNLAAMEPARLENGNLVIATVGAFPIIVNTGGLIITSGAVPAAAVGKNFTAYDDDDFNSNDAGALKGDTAEALVAPDRSLVQDSDVPASNVFAKGYVRPVYDLANANPTPPFLANQAGDAAANVIALYRYDNLASNVNDYWVIYMLGAYQPILVEDQDPAGNEFMTTGRVDGNRGQGAVTYLECVSTHELAALGAKVDKTTKPGCKANLANYKAAFRNAETTAHEVGHLFGGRHTDSGLMSDQCANVTLVFSDKTLDAIRSTAKP